MLKFKKSITVSQIIVTEIQVSALIFENLLLASLQLYYLKYFELAHYLHEIAKLTRNRKKVSIWK